MAVPRRLLVGIVGVLVAAGLVALAAAGGDRAAASTGVSATAAHASGPNCARTSVGFTPLNQLGTHRHDGFQGGLYPHGHNRPPKKYLKAGLAAAARIRPLAPNGTPSSSGRIVMLSVGMSNTYLEYHSLIEMDATNPLRSGNLLIAGTLKSNPHVELVNGATPSWDALSIINNEASYFGIVNSDLSHAGVTGNQVQAVWLYEAIENESEPFPADARRLQGALTTIIGMLKANFPNLRIVYVSSREYAGYATSPINPEPAAYDSGFSVKWAVAGRLAHPKARPWVAWGPYTWADGLIPRKPDGLTWSCDDFEKDGTHPSPLGADKAGGLLLHFFTKNKTSRTWFDG